MRSRSAERPAAQRGPQASYLGASVRPDRPSGVSESPQAWMPLGLLVPHIFSMRTERLKPGGQDLIGLEVYLEMSVEHLSPERPQALYLICLV